MAVAEKTETPRKIYSKVEFKAKRFAEKYIENGFNGAAAARAVYNPKNNKVAGAIATENLAKPVFQSAIIEAMEKAGLNDDFVSAIHERNLKQKQNYAASNGAMEMYYKVKGHFAPEKKLNVSLDIKSEGDLDAKLGEIMNELKVLQEGKNIPDIDDSKKEGKIDVVPS